MTTFRSDDVLVGIIALAVLPLIGLRIVRGVRDGRLPLYRTCLTRAESSVKFNALLALHALTFLLIALVAADLLLDLRLRDRL